MLLIRSFIPAANINQPMFDASVLIPLDPIGVSVYNDNTFRFIISGNSGFKLAGKILVFIHFARYVSQSTYICTNLFGITMYMYNVKLPYVCILLCYNLYLFCPSPVLNPEIDTICICSVLHQFWTQRSIQFVFVSVLHQFWTQRSIQFVFFLSFTSFEPRDRYNLYFFCPSPVLNPEIECVTEIHSAPSARTVSGVITSVDQISGIVSSFSYLN